MHRFTPIVLLALVLPACAPSGGGDGFTLEISSPQGEAYSNGELTVQVAVQGKDLAFVDLFLDEKLLVTLSPPFTYTWDTTGTAEGTYALTARHQSVVSDPVSVTLDRTAPTIVAQSPEPASANFFLGDPMVAEFSEPLDPSTVSSATVRVDEKGGGSLAAQVSLSADQTSVEILVTERPDSLPADLAVTFTDDVTDRAGNSLSLAPWELTLPVFQSLAMEDPNSNAMRSLAVRSDGSPVISWHETDGQGHIVPRIAVWDHDDWNVLPDVDFADLDNDAAWNMTLDADDTIYVTGYSSDGPTSLDDPTHVWVVKWEAGAWVPVGGLLNEQGSDSFAFYPDIAIDSTGAPVVAWTEHTNQVFFQRVARFDGTDWSLIGPALDEISTAYEYDYSNVSLALDSNDNPVVAWTEYNGVDRTDGHAAHWTGSDWDILPNISNYSGATSTSFIDLRVDGQDNIYASWLERNPDGNFELFAALAQAFDWQVLGDLNGAVPNTDSPSEIHMALDANGSPLVIWDEVVSQPVSHRTCYVASWDDIAGDWSLVDAPTEVFGGDTPADRGKVTVGGPFNQPIVGWEETDGDVENIYLRRYN